MRWRRSCRCSSSRGALKKCRRFWIEVSQRDQGTDLVLSGEVKVTPQGSMTRDLRVEWWIQYLERQRDSQLGVPKIFLGESEGTNRATAEVVMQEFITRLRMRQKHKSGVYETQLFPLILRGDFPESLITADKIPRMKWKPIWEPPTDVKMQRVLDLYNGMLMGNTEARAELGLPETISGNLKQPQQSTFDNFGENQGNQKQMPTKITF